MKFFEKMKQRRNEKIFSHPEVENYGLNCDYNLWIEFNKELLIRNITKMERHTIFNLNLLRQNPIDVNMDLQSFCNVDMITEIEREYALAKIATMIELGLLNKLTLLQQGK